MLADERLTKFWKVENTLTNKKGLNRTKKAKTCLPVGTETNNNQDDSVQRTPRKSQKLKVPLKAGV